MNNKKFMQQVNRRRQSFPRTYSQATGNYLRPVMSDWKSSGISKADFLLLCGCAVILAALIAFTF